MVKPKWMVEALKEEKKMESFLIKSRRAGQLWTLSPLGPEALNSPADYAAKHQEQSWR